MQTIAVIPVRMGSTRFPGKPLAMIHDLPMVAHVYHNAIKSDLIDKVYIATCDVIINDYAKSIGAPCIMTSNLHERCTDRVAEAVAKIENDQTDPVRIVVMIQGDEPMVTPSLLDQTVRQFQQNEGVEVVNVMSRIRGDDELHSDNVVKVVVDHQGNALYFSREPIPSTRKYSDSINAYKQTGVIAFRKQSLLAFNDMDSSPLEQIESVDMLRLLEHGKKVRMIPTSEPLYAVDVPSDILKVEAALSACEGYLEAGGLNA